MVNWHDDQAAGLRRLVKAPKRRVIAVASASPADSAAVAAAAALELTARGARVLVIEDGPTTTHGGMPYGAGFVAATRHGATPVDPRPHAVGAIADTFARYPHLEAVLPAMGYGGAQVRDLEATIGASNADVVVIATPVDLRRLLTIRQPTVRVSYAYADRGAPTLADALSRF